MCSYGDNLLAGNSDSPSEALPHGFTQGRTTAPSEALPQGFTQGRTMAECSGNAQEELTYGSKHDCPVPGRSRPYIPVGKTY